jgi:hypothetical protein
MKGLFHKLGLGMSGKKWRFHKADYSEVAEDISNPVRGWYQIHTFQAAKEPDFDELEWCLNRNDTLALVLIDIGEYRERDLDEEALGRICRILEFFSERRYDLILRVVYDREGRAMEREPFFFSQVLSHLRQIGGVLERYASCIFVYQGMLVGNWGEMHTSRFLSEDKMAQMAEALRYYRCGETYLAVRRPVYWRMLQMNQNGRREVVPNRMGLFDDGMFGSESHLGTFGQENRETAAWDSPWKREDELAFETELGQYAPSGGEAVYGSEFQRELTPEKVIADLRRMQVTYLNRIHDGKVLDIWRQCKYSTEGIWAGKSVYDYVGAHLGYRFLVRKVTASPGKGGGQCHMEILVENVGFGSFYQEAALLLVCVGDDGQVCARAAAGEMKGWCAGEKRLLACDVELCNCEMRLEAERKRDGARIRFANASDEEGRAVLGRLSAV